MSNGISLSEGTPMVLGLIIVALLTLVPLAVSFWRLNTCTKCTGLLPRLSYALIFTASVGVLLTLSAGILISGWCLLLLAGVTLHLIHSDILTWFELRKGP